MRFQARFDTPEVTKATVLRGPSQARKDLRPRNARFERYGVAAATLFAIAGCASTDRPATRAWKVEPVLSVTHAMASSEGYYRMGRYYDGMGQWSNAVDAYRRAVGADPRHVDAHNALGVALAQGGSYGDAEAVLRHALALAPKRADVRSNLGYVLMLAGRPEAAVTELRAALELDRDNPVALGNLREASARAGGVKSPDAIAAVVQPPANTARAVAQDAPREAAMHVNDRPTVASLQPEAMPVQPGSPSLQAGFTATQSDSTPARPEASGVQSSGVPASPAAAPSAQTAARVDALLEVSNGNGVSGMGARLRDWLAHQGVRTSRLSNQRPFAQEHTAIQYRAGHAESAQRVADALPAALRAVPALVPALRSDVRVVLGRDWVRSAACLERDTCGPTQTTTVALAPPLR